MVKVEQKWTRGDLTKIVLEVVKTTGLVTIALVAPKVVIAMKKTGMIDLGEGRMKKITNARLRLERTGYLKRNEKGYLRLTEKGREKIRKIEMNDYRLVIPKIWDKKWRMLIFDIKEERRNLREKVRNTLRSIGFVRLQDSVWVYPYDCSEFVSLLKADFKIGKDLLYIIADEIENDKWIKARFNLS